MPKIKRVWSGQYSWIKSPMFPKSFVFKNMSNHAILGIGGNIGDTLRRFDKLLVFMNSYKDISIVQTSPILKNPPFGFLEQEDFYNAVIEVSTSLTPKELLTRVLRIERHFKRERPFKDAPRTMDIDIIFFNDIEMDTPKLKLPHPGWRDRVSVYAPLSKLK